MYRRRINRSSIPANPMPAGSTENSKTNQSKPDSENATAETLSAKGLEKTNPPNQANDAPPEVNDEDKLIEAARKAHEVLYKVDTVFPFTLFPDTIILEREKISIAKRFFFRVAKIINIPIRDLLNVEADVGPFFGSVHITSRYFATEPFTVNWLWRSEAIKLQRLLQGYIITHEKEIDATNIKKDKLVKLLNDLGVDDT